MLLSDTPLRERQRLVYDRRLLTEGQALPGGACGDEGRIKPTFPPKKSLALPTGPCDARRKRPTMTDKAQGPAIGQLPEWKDHELALMGAETPVVFPLEAPPESEQEMMQKHWRRADLARYMTRWEGGYVPELPEALWSSFEWRACDVGCGFGLWVIRESERHPARAYLGIDKGKRRGSRLARECEQSGRPNLFALHGNAIPLLAKMPAESFDLITLFYPNPWWQNKHRQKRWAHHPLMPRMIELLKPGGRILLATNEKFVLEEWYYAMTHHPLAVSLLEEEYVGLIEVEEGRTHFESKFIAAGIACGEIRFRKVE